MRVLFNVAVAAVFGLLAVQPAGAASLRVKTERGVIQGKAEGAVTAYLGVPYAASTAGGNRWRAPQPAPAWRGARAADHFGADCQQAVHNFPSPTPWTREYLSDGPFSEDCLFVNVWTPAAQQDARRPVLVWIHGGAFAGGSGAVPVYDGAALARRGIVVVSLNYRLGVFGFMAHPALTAEAGTSGNYGLMDQVAALQWVQRNIARFGGDPGRVTIAGQSAGAASVHDLLAAPGARGLFVRAIAESGSGMGIAMPDLKAAQDMGERVARAAGVTTLSQLRSLPVAVLEKVADDPSVGPPGPHFAPIRDGVFLPDPAAQRGDVPVLTGYNADEASVSPDWSISTSNELKALLAQRFGKEASAFSEIYAADDSAARATARQMLRDRNVAAMSFWAEARPAGAAPVFAYLYDHAEPGPNAALFGAFHTAEVPYVFGVLSGPDRQFTTADRRISDTLGRYWVNFVATGDPNGPGLPAWPRFGSGRLMQLGDTVGPRPALSPVKQRAYRAFTNAGGRLGLF